MGKCIVVWCKNYSTSNKPPEISFHRIPTSGNSYTQVKRAIGRENLPKSSKICSAHFSKDCFQIKGNKKVLKPNSIPTLKLKPVKSSFKVKVVPVDESCQSVRGHTNWEPVVQPAHKNVASLPELDVPLLHPTVTLIEKSIIIETEEKQFCSKSDSERLLRQKPKRHRRNLKRNRAYRVSSCNLKKIIWKALKEKREAKKKMDPSSQNVIRLSKKVDDMKHLVTDLKSKNLVTQEASDVLEQSFSDVSLQLMQRILNNFRRHGYNKEISTRTEELQNNTSILFYTSITT